MREKRKAQTFDPIKRIRPWPYKKSVPSPFLLLIWTRFQVPLLSRLCINVTREVASYLNELVRLPGLAYGFIYMVNTVTRAFRAETSPFPGYDTQILPIDNTAALCMHRSNKTSERYYEVCWLDYETWTYTDLPGLIESAAEPKACYTLGEIYMFRDALTHLPVSPGEHYSVSSKKWSILSSPHPYEHVHFIFPVKANIYLLTLTGNQVAFQVFTPAANLFTAPILIDFLGKFNGGVYVQANETILSVRNNGLWSWNWKTHQVTMKKTLRGGKPPSLGCVMGMLVGRELFWISFGNVNRYDIDKREAHYRSI